MKISQIISDVCHLNRHLEYPTLCPSTILDKLNECWKYDPHERPSFHILAHNLYETKTELGKNIPDIQPSTFVENQQFTEHQVDKISDVGSIEQQDVSTYCHKYKKHKSCAIFTLLFIVMCSAGAIYAFRSWIFPEITTLTSIGKLL